MVEHRAQSGAPALAIRAALGGRALLTGIEVDVEVLGLEHLQIEALVLNLVAAEVLGVNRRGRQRQGEENQPEGAAGAASRERHTASWATMPPSIGSCGEPQHMLRTPKLTDCQLGKSRFATTANRSAICSARPVRSLCQ